MLSIRVAGKIKNVHIIAFFLLGLVVFACHSADDREKQVPSGTLRTDGESIEKGRMIFETKCIFCHETNTTGSTVGPGLKGVLKRARLPVSKKPATPENIAYQLKNPYERMPSFPSLSDEDIQNILAFLNTL